MIKSNNESSLNLDNVLNTRYGRQIALPEVGIKGQKIILASSVAIVGLGGLGSTCGQYLASTGIGEIKAIDHDIVQINNLHRQPLYSTRDCGRPKSSVFSAKLSALNPDTKTIPIMEYFDDDNAKDIIGDSQIIIDASDNFATRYAINRFCIKYNRIMVSSAIRHNSSSLCVLKPSELQDKPCFACAFPFEVTANIRNDCNDIGILGPVAGLAACNQAMTTINLLLNISEFTFNTLTLSEWKTNTHYKVKIKRNKYCKTCGKSKYISS